ncbi:hypothetical protein ScalyP_jg1875 [Parmales sp. scaly parma]|jgi:hypothetical protein|nr:hypothetical protein ScalyP_jg1875 [Parmales sp. scaly parma]|tara:strand:+ start:2428 stop:3285 length:858 start_codon:yes stop_codon:yes gene_type:complete
MITHFFLSLLVVSLSDSFKSYPLPSSHIEKFFKFALTERDHVRGWFSSSLAASSSQSETDIPLTEKILRRTGFHLDLSDDKKKIEFGSTVTLTSRINQINKVDESKSLAQFISNPRRVASLIWDPLMIEKIDRPPGDTSNSVYYRLKLMKLYFVMITLQPHVDMKMMTKTSSSGSPKFMMESVAYEPNFNYLILAGSKEPITAESLSLKIKVVGVMKEDGSDDELLQGIVGFLVSGNLPRVLRIVPRLALGKVCKVICNTIVNKLSGSFETTAQEEYMKFEQADL